VTAQEHGRQALASVFLASYGDCLRFALGMLGDRLAGEEAVQDAFLRLWARPPLLNDPLAAKAYVFRTIVNMGRSRQRRDAHRRVLEPAVPDQLDDNDVALSIDIRAALQALPARRRACVLMRYVLDYTERETADALRISIGTVKSQTHKALRQLREPLTPLAHLTYDADAAWRSLHARLDTAPQSQRGSRRPVSRPLLSASGVVAVVIAIVISAIVIVVGHGKHGANPHTVTPAGSLRSFSTNIHDVTTFTDTAGGLWLSSWDDATLTRVDAQTGASTSLRVGQPTSGIIAATTVDGVLFDVRFDTGQLEARNSTSGAVIRSTNLEAETNTLTARGSQLWATACCRSSTPSQTVERASG